VHILLVDDDAELSVLLSEFLHREGFTVECAHEGHLGLEMAARPGVDLVVLDVMLPGIDGFEILKRLRQKSNAPRPPAPSSRLEVNGITLDTGARIVFSHGKPVELTTFEFDILELLMRSAGHVLSRDALMENFYSRKATPFDRSLDMHISHLRKKLENGDNLIKTIRGVGYQFARSPEDAGAE
jgi:two-component system response regulator CpxR